MPMSAAVKRGRPSVFEALGRPRQTGFASYRARSLARKSITLIARLWGARVSKDRSKIPVSRVTDNFNRIARDLDRAATCAFAKHAAERVLWDRARELAWAFSSNPRPFSFPTTDTARMTEIHRTHLSDKIREMIQCRIFLEEDGKLTINKRYHEWTRKDGSPRLSMDQLDWCHDIIRRPKTEPVPEPEVSVTTDKKCRLQPTVDNCEVSVTTDSGVGYNRHECRLQPTAQYIGSRPETIRRGDELKNKGVMCSEEPSAAGAGDPPHTPPVSPVRSEPDQALVAEAVATLAAHPKTFDVSRVLASRQDDPDTADIPGAKLVAGAKRLVTVHVSDSKKRSYAYFLTCARNVSDDDGLTPKQRRARERADACDRNADAARRSRDGRADADRPGGS